MIVFDRIAEQVDDGLFELFSITQDAWQSVWQVKGESDQLFFGIWIKNVITLNQQFPDIELTDIVLFSS